MRAAEVLVELLLGEPPVMEARPYAFIYKDPKALDGLTKRQLKDEYDEIKLDRDLAQSGGNALIVDVASRKVRLLGQNPQAFWAALRQHGGTENFWKWAVAAERGAQTRADRKAKEGRWSDELERQKWREQHKEKEQARAQSDYEKEAGAFTLGAEVEPHHQGGLLVKSVSPGGPLSRLNVAPGMILKSFQGRPLYQPGDLDHLLAGASAGASYSVEVHVPGKGLYDITVTPERSAL